jgi:hypothetical protein
MAKRKGKSGTGGGGGALPLIVVLLVMGTLGAWNYHRNLGLEEEQAGSRPFQGYSDTALVDLAAAYGEQAEILERKYKASLQTRRGVRDADGLIMEQIEEFDRVQKIGSSIRVATSQVADSEARLRGIRHEQAWRRNERQWTLHLRRLTSI